MKHSINKKKKGSETGWIFAAYRKYRNKKDMLSDMNWTGRFQKCRLSYRMTKLYHHIIFMAIGFAPFGPIIAFFDIF